MALGVAFWMPVFITLMSVVQAISPSVAQHFGAGDHAAVVQDTHEGVWLAAVSSVLPAFLMPGVESLTVESRTPLSGFDLVAFSLSCEQGYGNVVEILRRAGIPPLAASRDARAPLVLGGGVCATLNPEPVADLFDLFVLGEAEEVLLDGVGQFLRG